MSSNRLHFEKLTPTDQAKIEVYSESFNFAFDNKDIKNVAITGPYGAGKSSVLESYKTWRKEKKGKELSFIHISLAHFETACQSEVEPVIEESKKSEVILEGKILNQLLHQIPPKKIPQSHFKTKAKISIIDTLKIAIPVFFGVLLAIYFWNFTHCWQWVEKHCLESDLTNWGAFILCLILAACLVFLLVHTLRNKCFFRKIALYGNEIEIFEHNNESFFDKYLNEVLYLFENAGADVIVFEDMDRFNYNQIFEKLREINYLVNAKLSNRIIRFFYLLRDDIFTSKDRTKFFDFLIPIVPVIDGSNSYDQFIEHFKKSTIFQDFGADFLRGISLYIDDMRILKNICNEYIVYHQRIQATELNCNKLFAIIVYKNLFPRDFSDSQLNKGFVFALFAEKGKLICQEVKKLETVIEYNRNLIKKAENEFCQNMDELDALFLKTNSYSNLSADGKTEQKFASYAEFVAALKKASSKTYQQHYNVQRINFDLQDALSELEKNEEYRIRKESLQIKETGAIQKIKEDNQSLQLRINTLRESKLQEVLRRENIDSFFSELQIQNDLSEFEKFESVKGNFYFPLLKYLVRNGYIDESYQDYMTYFYENSITRSDKIFLRSVTDEKAKEFSYELENPEITIKYLRPASFDQPETLNFDLLCFLLKNKREHIARFMVRLEKEQRYDFIAQFFARNCETPSFIESLNHHCPGVWKCICNSDCFSEQERHRYATLTLYYSSDDDVVRMNENNCLTDYISCKPDFLCIENPEVEKIKSKLILLNVRFEEINYGEADRKLFNVVYDSDLYLLNDCMIRLILNKVYGIPESEDYIHRNYSLIRTKPEEKLLKYVNESIGEYFDFMMELCEKTITDDEETALEILNNESIDEEKKAQYIQYLQTELTHISDVSEENLWSIMFARPVVNYSAENILEYFFCAENGMDETLVKFINNGSESISFDYENIDETFGEESGTQFLGEVIKCLALDNKKYRSFLKSLNRTYSIFTFEGISEDKIKILIELAVIKMTTDNLFFMRKNYPNDLLEFISSKPSVYANEAITAESFDLDELKTILKTSVIIKDEDVIKLLSYTNEPISVLDKNCSETVKVHLLQHHF
ncbi:MAG: hypothetical protein ACRC2T_20615, partial [Thermoguttaceae bacterium]